MLCWSIAYAIVFAPIVTVTHHLVLRSGDRQRAAARPDAEMVRECLEPARFRARLRHLARRSRSRRPPIGVPLGTVAALGARPRQRVPGQGGGQHLPARAARRAGDRRGLGALHVLRDGRRTSSTWTSRDARRPDRRERAAHHPLDGAARHARASPGSTARPRRRRPISARGPSRCSAASRCR